MTNADPDSLVAIFSTPLPFEAEIVKSMLADEEIFSVVENPNTPFPGLARIELFVTRENEAFARRLIEEHQALHKQNVDLAFEQEASESSETSPPTDEV